MDLVLKPLDSLNDVSWNIVSFLDHGIEQHDAPARSKDVEDSQLLAPQFEEPITQRF